jgi:hypothetical protein
VNGVGTKLDTKLTLINNSKGLVLSATIAGFCSVADASGGALVPKSIPDTFEIVNEGAEPEGCLARISLDGGDHLLGLPRRCWRLCLATRLGGAVP